MKKIKLILIAVVSLLGINYANAQVNVSSDAVTVSFGTYEDVVISSEFGIYDLFIDEDGSDLELVDCFILGGNSRSLSEVIVRIWGKVKRNAFAIVRVVVRVFVNNELVELILLIAVDIVESAIEDGSPADYLSETLVALKQKDWVIETA